MRVVRSEKYDHRKVFSPPIFSRFSFDNRTRRQTSVIGHTRAAIKIQFPIRCRCRYNRSVFIASQLMVQRGERRGRSRHGGPRHSRISGGQCDRQRWISGALFLTEWRWVLSWIFRSVYNERNVVSFDERFTWINAKDGSFPILDIYEIRNVDEYHVLFICRLSVYMSFTCEKFYFKVTDIYTCRKLFRYYSFLFTSFINTYTSCFNPETKSAFSSTFRTGYAPKIQEALSLSFEMNIQRAFCDSNLANFLCIVSLRRRK